MINHKPHKKYKTRKHKKSYRIQGLWLKTFFNNEYFMFINKIYEVSN